MNFFHFIHRLKIINQYRFRIMYVVMQDYQEMKNHRLAVIVYLKRSAKVILPKLNWQNIYQRAKKLPLKLLIKHN